MRFSWKMITTCWILPELPDPIGVCTDAVALPGPPPDTVAESVTVPEAF